MTSEQRIREGLKNLASKHGPINTILGVIKSVDEAENTCVLLDDDIEIPGVRLCTVLTEDHSFVLVPTVNKAATIIRLEDDADWQLFSCEKADKIKLKSNDTEILMSDGILIKRGADNLRDALDLIIDSVSQIVVLQGNSPNYAKLTQAKSIVDNLLKNA